MKRKRDEGKGRREAKTLIATVRLAAEGVAAGGAVGVVFVENGFAHGALDGHVVATGGVNGFVDASHVVLEHIVAMHMDGATLIVGEVSFASGDGVIGAANAFMEVARTPRMHTTTVPQSIMGVAGGVFLEERNTHFVGGTFFDDVNVGFALFRPCGVTLALFPPIGVGAAVVGFVTYAGFDAVGVALGAFFGPGEQRSSERKRRSHQKSSAETQSKHLFHRLVLSVRSMLE